MRRTLRMPGLGLWFAAAVLGLALVSQSQANLIMDIRLSSTDTTANVSILDFKHANITGPGGTIGIDIYAVIPSSDGDNTDEGLVNWAGGARQTVPGFGTAPGTYQVAGDLGPGVKGSTTGFDPYAGVMWDFQGGGRPDGEPGIWSRGTSIDQGNLLGTSAAYKDLYKDLGGVGTGATNWMFTASYLGAARVPNEPGSDATLVAHIIYTLRPGAEGYRPSGDTPTTIDVVTRGVATAATAGWFEEGLAKHNKTTAGGTAVASGGIIYLNATGGSGPPSMLAHLGEDPLVFTMPPLEKTVLGGGVYSTVASVVSGEGMGSGGAPILLINKGAAILAGVNTEATEKIVQMTWRVRTTVEGWPGNPQGTSGLLSNVLQLTGMGKLGVPPIDGRVPTDPFVLQMDFDIDALHTLWPAADPSGSTAYLAYLNPGLDGALGTPDDKWLAAVAGNFTGTPVFVNGAYRPLEDGLNVGHYGVDTANHVVWAVLDHNSQFAAVPEPGTLVLLGMGALVGLLVWRRKRA